MLGRALLNRSAVLDGAMLGRARLGLAAGR